ncbi:MAG TPA: hypothetical protein VFC85_05670 [Verrucomicrobiae bacterium]|nr:hypothetical protein [Verrucomicrobiae bacterium]
MISFERKKLIYAKKSPNPHAAPQVDQQRGAGRNQFVIPWIAATFQL